MNTASAIKDLCSQLYTYDETDEEATEAIEAIAAEIDLDLIRCQKNLQAMREAYISEGQELRDELLRVTEERDDSDKYTEKLTELCENKEKALAKLREIPDTSTLVGAEHTKLRKVVRGAVALLDSKPKVEHIELVKMARKKLIDGLLATTLIEA